MKTKNGEMPEASLRSLFEPTSTQSLKGETKFTKKLRWKV